MLRCSTNKEVHHLKLSWQFVAGFSMFSVIVVVVHFIVNVVKSAKEENK